MATLFDNLRDRFSTNKSSNDPYDRLQDEIEELRLKYDPEKSDTYPHP